jgi:hypothetical protein
MSAMMLSLLVAFLACVDVCLIESELKPRCMLSEGQPG